MFNSQEAKKENEALSLELFIEVYKFSTENTLIVQESEENPDFICTLNEDKTVGIELAKIMRDPRDAFLSDILDKQEEMEAYDALETIYYFIERKEKARKKRYVNNVNETILVLELVDGSLSSYMYFLDSLKGDFNNHNFLEIWLADYSEIEEYGDIELYCLHPVQKWGYKQRPNPERKPYG